jgi:F-type H+-transporting ATPase subunit epsilon
MPAPFKASLITPEAILLEASVVFAQIPAHDGLVGILEKRAPLLAKMGTGVLRLDTAPNVSQRFLVSGGYAQMKGDELTILTTEAIPAKQITQETIAGEQAKLAQLKGTDLKAMEQRSAIENRIHAMRSLIS